MQTACPSLAIHARLRQLGRVHGADLVLALLAAVAALVTIARKVGVAYPILLLIGAAVVWVGLRERQAATAPIEAGAT